MDNEPLVFDLKIGKSKPTSYAGGQASPCPFENISQLTDIYRQEGDMIWLKNKFPTLEDTAQTIIIESANHDGDISNYSVQTNRALMKFALTCFNQMRADPSFKSVLWYKNFGRQSGGSLVHPHMQIVGLKKEDGYKYIHENNFAGVPVFDDQEINVNVATHPVQGYLELNINTYHCLELERWSDWIQLCVQYLLTSMYARPVDSYNLFFYPSNQGQGICAKLLARFTAPPYFVGYKLSQVDDLASLIKQAQALKKYAKKRDC